MNRTIIICGLSWCCLWSLWACTTTTPDQDDRPNIVLIVTDDLGIGSLSCYNSQFGIPTPNIDRLAQQGWQYDQFYVTSSVCSPSRVSILTGKSPQVAGVEKVLKPGRQEEQNGMAPASATIATKLQEAGYHTALIGKWHLGYQPEEQPTQQGFQTFAGFINGHIDYISHQDPNGDFELMKEGKVWRTPPKKHLTEVLTDEAIAWVKQKSNAPYFLMLSYANPHVPILLPGEEALFPGKGDPRVDTPKRYQQLVSLLDQEVGKLVAAIEAQHDNTLVVFISDHGCPQRLAGNGPYLGGKGTLLEGGIKVPAILYWPGVLSPQRIPTFATSLDLFPTLLATAGMSAPQDGTQTGHSLLDSVDSTNNIPYYWNVNGMQAVRAGNWKALFCATDQANPRIIRRYLESTPAVPLKNWKSPDGKSYHVWLFDLGEDPTEKANLATTQPEKITEMWADLVKTQNK
ncbi:MAG: hypothetical protein DA408_20465 [Bacteroidetes bacterium]|nr:MAG: hypothetical protein DA408_20465 [Bacteroidota bacterium]